MVRRADTPIAVSAGADVLVMLAKPPVPGRVKTRLCGGEGVRPEEAAELAAACIRDATRRLSGGAWAMAVCHPPGAAVERLAALLPAAVSLYEEPVLSPGPREFGAAMADVFTAQLGAGRRRVVIIGSDCPQLPVRRVEEAFAALAGCDLVLGPDEGGGCYLLGARRPLDILTAACGLGPVAWSQGTDYRELVRRASTRGVPLRHLAPEYDLDGPRDLARLAEDLDASRIRTSDLPDTAAWVRRWQARAERVACS